jgi:hypothetical protein
MRDAVFLNDPSHMGCPSHMCDGLPFSLITWLPLLLVIWVTLLNIYWHPHDDFDYYMISICRYISQTRQVTSEISSQGRARWWCLVICDLSMRWWTFLPTPQAWQGLIVRWRALAKTKGRTSTTCKYSPSPAAGHMWSDPRPCACTTSPACWPALHMALSHGAFSLTHLNPCRQVRSLSFKEYRDR